MPGSSSTRTSTSPTAQKKQLLPENRAAARVAAGRSVVLLKNNGPVLPISPSKSTALIGPLGDSGHDMLGPWWGRGDDNDAVSLFAGMKKQNPNTTYTPGCTISHNDLDDPANECATVDTAAVIAAAQAADQIIVAVGETREMGGEAEARSNLDLPGKQQELIDAVASTGKPFAVVLFNSRPLTLSKVDAAAPAILEAWFGGVEAGNGVADVLFGKVNPGGKLPVSFPRNVGQVPIYYNHEPTGRPCDVTSKYNSRHRDIGSCAPLYAFGYGLSYTTFKVDNLRLSSPVMSSRGAIIASVDVTNTGTVEGDDVAQLYIHDPVASLSQPVRRLRGFERVTLKPGEKKTVSWKLDAERRRLLRQQGPLPRRAGRDRGLRGRQLGRGEHAGLHRALMRCEDGAMAESPLWRCRPAGRRSSPATCRTPARSCRSRSTSRRRRSCAPSSTPTWRRPSSTGR